MCFFTTSGQGHVLFSTLTMMALFTINEFLYKIKDKLFTKKMPLCDTLSLFLILNSSNQQSHLIHTRPILENYLCNRLYCSHTYIHSIYKRTFVRTNLALSCVHFPMFGVGPRAAQPLKTGDNICPPSLSVLQSTMVRPLLPLQLLIPPMPYTSAFLLWSSFAPAFLCTPSFFR